MEKKEKKKKKKVKKKKKKKNLEFSRIFANIREYSRIFEKFAKIRENARIFGKLFVGGTVVWCANSTF